MVNVDAVDTLSPGARCRRHRHRRRRPRCRRRCRRSNLIDGAVNHVAADVSWIIVDTVDDVVCRGSRPRRRSRLRP